MTARPPKHAGAKREGHSRVISLVVAAILVCGCASTGRRITRGSPEYQQAVQTFGEATNLFFVTVPPRGPIDDSLVSAMSAAGPSAVSRQIGEIVAMAETRKVDLAVTGVSPLKTRVSLMKGLEIHKGRYLSNLRVLYIGLPSDRDAVEEAVRSVGGQFFFAERESI